jgi:hypothetical protein
MVSLDNFSALIGVPWKVEELCPRTLKLDRKSDSHENQRLAELRQNYNRPAQQIVISKLLLAVKK